MNKHSKETDSKGAQKDQDLPADNLDTRSLSDDATFGDQPDNDPQSLGDGATFGDQPARGPQSLGDEATFGDSRSGSSTYSDVSRSTPSRIRTCDLLIRSALKLFQYVSKILRTHKNTSELKTASTDKTR